MSGERHSGFCDRVTNPRPVFAKLPLYARGQKLCHFWHPVLSHCHTRRFVCADRRWQAWKRSTAHSLGDSETWDSAIHRQRGMDGFTLEDDGTGRLRDWLTLSGRPVPDEGTRAGTGGQLCEAGAQMADEGCWGEIRLAK